MRLKWMDEVVNWNHCCGVVIEYISSRGGMIMSRSSEVLFFQPISDVLANVSNSFFSPFLAGVLSPITNGTRYKKDGGFFSRWPISSLIFHQSLLLLYSLYRQLIVDDGPRAIPILF